MFKQILSFKEISDLSQKKANLIKAYPANSYIRLGEMLINDNDEYKNEIRHLKARIVELEVEVDNLKRDRTASVKDKYKNQILSTDEECTHATGFHSVDRLNNFY